MKVHVFFDYNPSGLEETAWLRLFDHQGNVYWQDDAGVKLVGEDTPETRKAATQKAWAQALEWEETRTENVFVQRPEETAELTLQECLVDDYLTLPDEAEKALR